MDRRTLELRVQEQIDSGLNPCECPELLAVLRKHPDLRAQAEELYRVDQMLRCAACAGEPGCDCDTLLSSVLDRVEDIPQDTDAKSGSWVFRVGIPAVAFAGMTASAFADSNVGANRPVPSLRIMQLHRCDADSNFAAPGASAALRLAASEAQGHGWIGLRTATPDPGTRGVWILTGRSSAALASFSATVAPARLVKPPWKATAWTLRGAAAA